MLRRFANFLQKVPWTVSIARSFWRLTQPRFTAGVAGVIFNDKGQVLLVEHVFHPYAPWGLPGGWIDRRESPAEAIARELREELELNVRVGPILLVGTDHDNHLDFAYVCYNDQPVGRLSHELLDYGWYDPANLPRLHRFHYRAIQSALKMTPSVSEMEKP